MASFMSDYLKSALLAHVHGGPDYARPATTYLALMTAAPSGAGGGTEAAGTGYARLPVTNNGTNWDEVTPQQITNIAKQDWGLITGNLGTVVGVAEYDADPAGNLLNYADLSTPRVVNNMDFYIDIGGIIFDFTECV